jgi:hypothetical protein
MIKKSYLNTSEFSSYKESELSSHCLYNILYSVCKRKELKRKVEKEVVMWWRVILSGEVVLEYEGN